MFRTTVIQYATCTNQYSATVHSATSTLENQVVHDKARKGDFSRIAVEALGALLSSHDVWAKRHAFAIKTLPNDHRTIMLPVH